MRKAKEKKHAVLIPEDLNAEYKRYADAHGMKTSQAVRLQLRKGLDVDIDLPAITHSLITLSEQIRTVKGKVSKKEYSEMADLINNIIKLLD